MAESLQHKLDRIRPPRVQLTYDVETGGAIEMKELPFVMGVMADLSGKQEDPLPLLRDRKFVEIDRDNFNEVMEAIRPRLAFSVTNKLGGEEEHLGVELFFTNMDDFSPVSIVKQIPALKELFQSRTNLNDLVAKLDGNDVLGHLLNSLMLDADLRKKILAEIDAGQTPENKEAPNNAKASEEAKKE